MTQTTAHVTMTVIIGWLLAASADAKSLRQSLVPQSDNPLTQQIIGGSIATLAPAIGSQVANQIPTLSTSAGYTYVWNPELEALERSAKTFGPLFTEPFQHSGIRSLEFT